MVRFAVVRRGYFSEIFTSFQGEGIFAGRRHVFVRAAGCNLRCRYCDTPGSLERTPVVSLASVNGSPAREIPNPLTAPDLTRLVAPFLSEGRGVHAVAITGGEPLVQGEFLSEWLEEARFAIPVLLETNGMLPDQMSLVRPWVSIVSMDVKLPSSSGERDFFDRHREFLEAAGDCELYVKVPVDDGTVEDEVARAARLLSEVRPGTPMFLQPILTRAAGLAASVPSLERFYDVATEWLDDVRVLPQAHPFLGIR